MTFKKKCILTRFFLSCELVIRAHAAASALSYFFKLRTWLVFMPGCVKHSCVSPTVFVILDAANDPRTAQTQKNQTNQLINKTPVERAVGKRHASIATPKRNRKQFAEPVGKWWTTKNLTFKKLSPSALQFQIRVVVVVSVTLLPDFRAEHRIGVLERDCSPQEPQQARHLCRHSAYSTAGVLQLPERPV